MVKIRRMTTRKSTTTMRKMVAMMKRKKKRMRRMTMERTIKVKYRFEDVFQDSNFANLNTFSSTF